MEFAEAPGQVLSCPLNASLLPVIKVQTPTEINSDLKALHSCVIQEKNQNLTPAQKELLKWHWRLGHMGFK